MKDNLAEGLGFFLAAVGAGIMVLLIYIAPAVAEWIRSQ